MFFVYIILGIIVIYVLFSLAIAYYAFNKTLVRKKVPNYDQKKHSKNNVLTVKNAECYRWWKSLVIKEITINNEDIKLYGNYYDQSSFKSVILVHGINADLRSRALSAKFYANLGYNVLLIDLRSSGKSDGKYITMGFLEKDDVICWINYLNENTSTKNIVLDGVSMGAATVMNVSSHPLKNVRCIVADCGFTSTYDIFKYQFQKFYHFPTLLSLHFLNIIINKKTNTDIKKDSPIVNVSKSLYPLLFIHGEEDKFVPLFMVNELYESCTSIKEKIIISEAKHATARYVNEEVANCKVEVFLNKYIID